VIIPYLVWSCRKGLTQAYRESCDVSRQSVGWLEWGRHQLPGLLRSSGFHSAPRRSCERREQIVTLDIELPRVQHAPENVRRRWPTPTLQFKDGVFDLVTHRCPRTCGAAPLHRQAYRVLRPGGCSLDQLAFASRRTTSRFHCLGPRLGYRVACKVAGGALHQVPYDHLADSHRSDARMLKASGFRVAKMTPRHCKPLIHLPRAYRPEFLTVNCQLLLEAHGER
jgi:hypothetical protein